MNDPIPSANASEVPAFSGMTCTYDPADNKLRISAVSRLPKDLYERVRAAGFIWAPRQEIFVAPMWTPEREDLALELCGEIDDEDTSLVDRAEERAERFEGYEERRTADATSAHAAVDRITSGIPLGQPILVGHHSERRARKDAEKITNGLRRAVKLWETAEYWKRRAAGAVRHAKYVERPDVRYRRIKGLEADARKHEKTKKESEHYLALWLRSDLTFELAKKIANYDRVRMGTWSGLDDGTMTAEQARGVNVPLHEQSIARCNRWLAHLANRITYEKAMLGETGGIAAQKFDLQIGGKVQIGREWHVILRLNKKGGEIVSVRTTARFVPVRGVEEISAYEPPDEGDAAKVLAATKLAPMVNFPDGAEPMLKETWDRMYKDYKGSRTIAATAEHGAYRRRTAIVKGSLSAIFLSDAKRVDPPPPAGGPPPPRRDELIVALNVPPPEPRAPRPPTAPSPAEALRTQLKAGIKVVSSPDLFPTPPDLAARIVALAGVEPGHSVLEPSAGTGNLLREIMKVHSLRVTAVEINGDLSERLRHAWDGERDPYIGIVHQDFLSWNAGCSRFDRVVMNPPFSNGADIDHVTHAFYLLKPGGRLVAVMSTGVKFRSDKKTKVFRALVASCDGTIEDNAPDAFKASGTMVQTVTVVLERRP